MYLRHLDTSHLDIDVQPKYIRVTIKGKILQLSLPCEVKTEKSFAKRNMVTGNLVITMPRINPCDLIIKKPIDQSDGKFTKDKNHSSSVTTIRYGTRLTTRELLEIGPPIDDLDFSKIYKNSLSKNKFSDCSKDFVDNPDVPPLE